MRENSLLKIVDSMSLQRRRPRRERLVCGVIPSQLLHGTGERAKGKRHSAFGQKQSSGTFTPGAASGWIAALHFSQTNGC